MQIAAAAYGQLTPAARARVDVLLRINPDYPTWVAGVPDADRGKVAFVRASTWADEIKDKPAYIDEKPIDWATAGQNLGYADLRKHKYWHFKDLPFSPDGTKTDPADPVNLATQIVVFADALAAPGTSPDIASYDLVWLIHLVGDAHQPLHAVGRFTATISGDQGGNSETVTNAKGETLPLHFYWDGIFGGYSTVYGALKDLKDNPLPAPDSKEAAIADPDAWISNSFELARLNAYAPPVGPEKGPYELTRAYETNTRIVSRAQAALAAIRLANLINKALQ